MRPDLPTPLEHQSSQQQIVAALTRQLQQLQSGGRTVSRPAQSTGWVALDRLLPAGGLGGGTLTEWIAAVPGSGASLLALVAALQACRSGRHLVVVDGRRTFYPPAAAAWGVDLHSLILVRPTAIKDQQWAIDQALRVPAVGAVLAWPTAVDPRTFRRWQLAAESSGTQGMLVRPATARQETSWSDVRWEVRSVTPKRTILAGDSSDNLQEEQQTVATSTLSDQSWSIQVELLRAPGGNGNCGPGKAVVSLADVFHQQSAPATIVTKNPG